MLNQELGSHLHLFKMIRAEEAAHAIRFFPAEGKILDIGAGSGYQSQYFQSKGYLVQAIDILERRGTGPVFFPVQPYDGQSIPFPDETFDVVFSSNVLEHILDYNALLVEMRRVLKMDGVMVHVIPTPAWRFWTNFAHYLAAVKKFKHLSKQRTQRALFSAEQLPNRKNGDYLFRGLLPSRHGVKGNFLSEFYYFSAWRWKRIFASQNLRWISVEKSGLFYTGYGIPGSQVSIPARKTLATLLGSTTRFYVLKKSSTPGSSVLDNTR